MRLCTEAHSKKRQIKTGLVPPPPIILSRTDSSVTLRPDAWIMRKKNAPEAESKEEKLDETAQVSRPATKNSTLSVAPPKVAYYRLIGYSLLLYFFFCHEMNRSSIYFDFGLSRVYAKTYGAGTDVSLKCTNYVNTGVPISPTASHITISGLLPNEKYVFAIAAYDEDDELIGGKKKKKKTLVFIFLISFGGGGGKDIYVFLLCSQKKKKKKIVSITIICIKNRFFILFLSLSFLLIRYWQNYHSC